jgi:hypothetical protein
MLPVGDVTFPTEETVTTWMMMMDGTKMSFTRVNIQPGLKWQTPTLDLKGYTIEATIIRCYHANVVSIAR